MRRLRQRLLRIRIAWARAVARVPRPHRRALRHVLLLGLGIAAAAAMATAGPPAEEIRHRFSLRPLLLAAQDAVARLPGVDEPEGDERLAAAALRMAMPVAFLEGQKEPRPALWAGWARRVIRALTGIDPSDPASWLAGGLPGFNAHIAGEAGAALPASARTLDRPGGPSSSAAQPAPPAVAPAPAPAALGEAAPLPRAPVGTASRPQPAPTEPVQPPVTSTAVLPPAPPAPEPPVPASPLDRLRSAGWGDQCLVLIYHTHTSEMYRTDAFAPASPDQYHRFNTVDTGIVQVGRALAARLQELGVPACHDTTIHDWPSHPRAYIEARATLQRLLAANPGVEIVLDVHRDAPEGLIATVGGRRAAQIAFVVGTHPGMQPNWRENAAFAADLAQRIEARYPGLFRRIIERPDARLNQDLHPRAVLVEVGSYDTHVEEAVLSAEILAEVVADMLYFMRFGRSAFE